jgi:hypothetical protein
VKKGTEWEQEKKEKQQGEENEAKQETRHAVSARGTRGTDLQVLEATLQREQRVLAVSPHTSQECIITKSVRAW